MDVSTEELIKELIFLDPVFKKKKLYYEENNFELNYEKNNYEYLTKCIVFENDDVIAKTFDITLKESVSNGKLFTRFRNSWTRIDMCNSKCRLPIQKYGVWCQGCYGEINTDYPEDSEDSEDSDYEKIGPKWYTFLKNKLTFDRLQSEDIEKVSVKQRIMDVSDKADLKLIYEHLKNEEKQIKFLQEKEEKLYNRIGSKKELEKRLKDALHKEKKLERHERIKQRKIEEIQKQIDLLQSQKEDLST